MCCKKCCPCACHVREVKWCACDKTDCNCSLKQGIKEAKEGKVTRIKPEDL